MAELLNIGYGKEAVSVYRTDGVNSLFAAEVGMTARGEAFGPSYTEGDNTLVIATDSMKNFIQITALDYQGRSLDGFLELLAERFLMTYEHVARVELHGRELPFARRSLQSFQQVGGDYAVAEVALEPNGAHWARSGRAGLRLVKLTGSSFEHFLRDEYTTLADSRDRPLFIHLDLLWRHADVLESADGEAVRDSVVATFADFDSASIQQLVHEMGLRALALFPQIGEISFVAENRLWDTAQVHGPDQRVRVYTDPRPPYGRIELTLTR